MWLGVALSVNRRRKRCGGDFSSRARHGVRLAMLKEIGTGAVFIVLTVVSGFLTTAIDARARLPAKTASPTQLASRTPFGAICRTSEIGDARPDPAWVQ